MIKIRVSARLLPVNTMAKPATKTARVLVKANKMADSCASNFNANSVALRRGCLQKHLLIESFAVLRRSAGCLGRFVTVRRN